MMSDGSLPDAWKNLMVVMVCGSVLLLSAAAQGAALDPFMGDWQGTWELTDGYNSGSLVAQVIALGGGQYQARLLEGFDVTTEPYGVLEGQLQGDKGKLSGRLDPATTTIEGGTIEVTIDKDKLIGQFRNIWLVEQK